MKSRREKEGEEEREKRAKKREKEREDTLVKGETERGGEK